MTSKSAAKTFNGAASPEDEDEFDAEVFSRALEASYAQAKDMISSWVPQNASGSSSKGHIVNSRNGIVQGQTPFALRPARCAVTSRQIYDADPACCARNRLGLGADSAEAKEKAMTDDKIRRQLLGGRKVSEVQNGRVNGKVVNGKGKAAEDKAVSSDDEQESRAGAISKKKVGKASNGVFKSDKQKSQKPASIPSAQPVASTSEPIASTSAVPPASTDEPEASAFPLEEDDIPEPQPDATPMSRKRRRKNKKSISQTDVPPLLNLSPSQDSPSKAKKAKLDSPPEISSPKAPIRRPHTAKPPYAPSMASSSSVAEEPIFQAEEDAEEDEGNSTIRSLGDMVSESPVSPNKKRRRQKKKQKQQQA